MLKFYHLLVIIALTVLLARKPVCSCETDRPPPPARSTLGSSVRVAYGYGLRS